MKLSMITKCKVVLFCESVIVCTAMAASIVVKETRPIDLNKCSLDYMRKIVMESCIRPHSHIRQARHAAFINNNNPVPDMITPSTINKEYENYKKILSRVPRELLPVDSTIVIRRKPKRIRKRSVDSRYDFYFHYCCNHMEICENMDCP